MIYTVSSQLSTPLAIQCADLFKPSQWTGKNNSFEAFMIAKLYLLTTSEEVSMESTSEKLKIHLKELSDQGSLSTKTDEACQVIVFLSSNIKTFRELFIQNRWYYGKLEIKKLK